jgi:tRNA threonylcarbamoyladenosine biosynthesis protein TsaB
VAIESGNEMTLLLTVDTSGKNGSLALALAASSPSQSDVSILEVVQLSGGAFSAELIPQIAALLKRHGYSKTDLEAFAVASGPGSFTGLRVGLAAIKALAEVLQKPIAAISLLEAVARGSTASSAPHGSKFLSVLDAGRGDVYVGDYEVDPNHRSNAQMRSERLLGREEFVAEASAGETKTVITPDALIADMIRVAGIRVEQIDYPNSASIARLGWEHLQRGDTVRPEDLEANYIRRSDAEIFSKPAR